MCFVCERLFICLAALVFSVLRDQDSLGPAELREPRARVRPCRSNGRTRSLLFEVLVPGFYSAAFDTHSSRKGMEAEIPKHWERPGLLSVPSCRTLALPGGGQSSLCHLNHLLGSERKTQAKHTGPALSFCVERLLAAVTAAGDEMCPHI